MMIIIMLPFFTFLAICTIRKFVSTLVSGKCKKITYLCYDLLMSIEILPASA